MSVRVFKYNSWIKSITKERLKGIQYENKKLKSKEEISR